MTACDMSGRYGKYTGRGRDVWEMSGLLSPGVQDFGDQLRWVRRMFGKCRRAGSIAILWSPVEVANDGTLPRCQPLVGSLLVCHKGIFAAFPTIAMLLLLSTCRGVTEPQPPAELEWLSINLILMPTRSLNSGLSPQPWPSQEA